MASRRCFGEAFAAVGFWMLLCTPAAPQTITGTIIGTARDTAGGPMPGVTLQITSASLQGVRTATTEADGRFRFPAVPPGIYMVKASLPGFRAAEKEATVTLDATVTADFALEPELQESVAVSGSAPLVDTTSTTTGTSYTSRVITHLPVSRNYADIVRSNPGVLPDTGETQGRSLALSIYGSTSVEHQWIIDGVNTTNVLKGMQGKAINNEFVQEVEVKTGGYQAEYGRAIGGVINVITKSGGNEFHGDAFVYYDSSALEAEREFVEGVDSELTGMRIADYTRADYGADLGGFVIKDRLWFFAAYNRVTFPAEISRYVSSRLVSNTDLFPLETTDNLYSGKLTWNLAASTTIVGSVFADPTSNTGANRSDPRLGGQPISNPAPGTWESTRTFGGTDFGLRLTQLLGSSALLTVQAARHQDRYELVPTGPGLEVRFEDFKCEAGDVGTPDDSCDIPGEANVVEGGLGIIGGPTNNSKSHRDQIRLDSTFFRGNHEIKVGGDYQDGQTEALSYFSGGQRVRLYNENGQDYYQHEFFAASPLDLTPIDSPNKAITRDVGAYIQDSWKAAPNLTINAGLRFDQEGILKYTGETAFRTTEWQPRLGVVWDPLGDGSSKVYAFAGRFSYALPTDLAIRVYGSQFSIQTYNFVRDSVAQDPNVIGHEDFAFQGGGFGEPNDPGMKGYSQEELTLGVEKTLSGGTLSLGLKGTYRRLSNAIEDRCDLDYTAPENGNTCALLNPGSDGAFARGDFHYCTGLDDFNNCYGEPLFGTLAIPEAKRIYRGIELVANKTFTRNLWLQASYVFSSLRGNYDGAVSEGTGQTDPGINADYDYSQFLHNAYGRLYLDRPHQLRLDGYYVTPFGLSVGLQTWARSGAPLNKYGYFNAFYGAYIQIVPKGYAGRLPTEWDGNLTLAYPIRIGPVTATLQGYVFNLFNNQIRTAQDTTWNDQPQRGYPDTIFDPNQASSDGTNYGLITDRSGPRLFRAAIRISF